MMSFFNVRQASAVYPEAFGTFSLPFCNFYFRLLLFFWLKPKKKKGELCIHGVCSFMCVPMCAGVHACVCHVYGGHRSTWVLFFGCLPPCYLETVSRLDLGLED